MLTTRRKRFVEEYLIRGDGHGAAVAAGYSERTASQAATNLLRVPEIADAIREGQEEKRRRSKIRADRVIFELAAIAFADIGRMVGNRRDGWALKPPHELSPEDRAAIAEIATRPDGAMRVRFHSKLRALEELSRLLGFGPEDQRQAEAEEMSRATDDARERLMRRLEERAKRRAEEAKTIDAQPALPKR